MMMDVVAAGLDELHERIAGRFARAEPRARVREYVSGLVTGLERKNGWTLAEWAGEVCPDGGRRSRLAPGRMARGSTTGRGSRSGPDPNAAAGTGCWLAGP
jgi:hypothetical protein